MAGLPPNFFNLCRTCKKPTTKDCKTLFNEEVSAFFDKYPLLRSSDLNNERLPRVVCKSCFDIMDFVNKFVWRAERVKKEFEQIAPEEPPNDKKEATPAKRKCPTPPGSSHSDKENESCASQTTSPPTKTIKISSSLTELAQSNPAKNYLICSSCRIIFQTVEEATIHEMNHKTIKHVCEVCNTRFNTVSGLKKHLQLGKHSSGQRTWSCSVCSFFHVKWTEVKNHLGTQHKLCLECTSFWRTSLDKSKGSIGFVRTKFCETCGKMLKFKHEKDELSSLRGTSSQSYEEASCLEDGISEMFEVMKSGHDFLKESEIKKEVSEEPFKEPKEPVEEDNFVEESGPEFIPDAVVVKPEVPFEITNVTVRLEKLSPDFINDALKGKKSVKTEIFPDEFSDSDEMPFKTKYLVGFMEQNCDAEGSKSDFPVSSEGPSCEKVKNSLLSEKKVTVVNLKCKYCSMNFDKQMEYIKHLRSNHL